MLTRVLRDADRVAGIGETGVIREAYYMGPGFRHPAFTKRTEKEVMEDGLVCDMRYPLEPDYERGVEEFVYKNVFPYLVKNGLVGEMVEKLKEHMYGIVGKRNEGGVWEIEPVLTSAKILATQRLYSLSQIYLDLLPLKFK